MPTVRYTVANGQIIAEKRTVRRFYQTDALGSVIGLFDSNQTKTDAATYWPYGGTRTSSGTFGSKMGFVGSWGCRKQIDGDIYMRARVQEPKDGRWLTVDPLWPREAAYAYVGLSPTTWGDPGGTGDLLKWLSDLIFGPKIDPIHMTREEGTELFYGFPTKPVCIPKFAAYEFPPPIYGFWCGPQGKLKRGLPTPGSRDVLDDCCRTHDKCWEKLGCGFWNQLWREECKVCTSALCACFKKIRCGWSDPECTVFRNFFEKVYCRRPFI